MAIKDANELAQTIRAAFNSCEGYNGTDKRVGLAIGPVTGTHFNVFDPDTGVTYLINVYNRDEKK